MEIPFDIEEDQGGVVKMVPDFFKAELPRESVEREVYQWYLDAFPFENGALTPRNEIYRVMEPPEKVTLRELDSRVKAQYGGPMHPVYLEDEGEGDW